MTLLDITSSLSGKNGGEGIEQQYVRRKHQANTKYQYVIIPLTQCFHSINGIRDTKAHGERAIMFLKRVKEHRIQEKNEIFLCPTWNTSVTQNMQWSWERKSSGLKKY